MRIYISIPISGHDLATQRAKAAEIAERITALGHEPVNPFDTPEAPAEMDEREKYSYYMGEDIKRLLLCNAIYFWKDWQHSHGCMLEYYAAKIYGLRLYADMEDIANAK